MNNKICAFVGCTTEISGEYDLCFEHNKKEKKGLINKCPECGKYKSSKYPLCIECNEKVKAKIVPEHSEAWEKGDEGVDKFFVYIIKHDGGFYKGHTRELKVRMSKHRDGLEPPTKGRNPKLKYFEVLPSRDSAEKREVELKKLNDSEIRRLIIDFEGWIQELNKED